MPRSAEPGPQAWDITALCYAKTEAGREEIRQRSRRLSRAARNLLLMVNTQHSAASWLQLIHGSSEADLRQLIGEGLIAPAAPALTGAPAAAGHTPAAPRVSVQQALAQLGYEQLYTLLTSQARDRLGLFQGYRFVLEVEKAANVDELRALALRFIDLVQQAQGEDAARQMRLAIGAA